MVRLYAAQLSVLPSRSRFDFSNTNYNYDNSNTNVSVHLSFFFSGINPANTAKNKRSNENRWY